MAIPAAEDNQPLEFPQKTNGSTPCDWCNRTRAEGCICSNPHPTESDLAQIAKGRETTRKISEKRIAERKAHEAEMREKFPEAFEDYEEKTEVGEASSGVVKAESNKDRLERIRKARNLKVSSKYIRIGQSDLYDYQPVRRAVLKEIAFMEVHDEQTKIPKDSPYKGSYEGWCYASQRFLAARVGTTEGYVRNSVALFEKDGVIDTRLWYDQHGYPHQEYHVYDEVVTDHQRADDYLEHERKTPRRGGNTKPNKGSFKLGNKVRATAHDSRSHRTPQPYATAHDSRNPPHTTAVMPPHTTADSGTAAMSDKAVMYLGGIKPSEGKDSSVRASTGHGTVPAAAAAAEGGGVVMSVASTQSKTKVSSVGMERRIDLAGKHTESKPLVRDKALAGTFDKPKGPIPNILRYPDEFKNWRRGMRVPKHKPCGQNLQPNEHHECEGYVPQYEEWDVVKARGERLAEDREERLAEAWEKEWEVDDGEEGFDL